MSGKAEAENAAGRRLGVAQQGERCWMGHQPAPLPSRVYAMARLAMSASAKPV